MLGLDLSFNGLTLTNIDTLKDQIYSVKVLYLVGN